MIDYRTLLLKYLQYVLDEEGSNLIEYGRGYASDVQFTDEEWKELQLLDKENQKNRKQG